MEYKKNEDGSLFLDENGNHVPLKNTEKEDESDADVKAALIEELKELRKERAIYKEIAEGKLAEEKKPVEKIPEEEEKIISTVKKVLDEEKSGMVKANKQAAINKYITENKEFHPENDSLGLKRDALLNKLNLFNTSSLSTVDEFYSVIRDAHRLLVGFDKQPDTEGKNKNPYSDSPTPKPQPQPVAENGLTQEEKKLIETSGWTVEKYLKTKEKHGDMIAGLLSRVRV